MKTVKTPSDLNKMALKSGGRVKSEAGQEFNTTRVRAEAPERMEPEVPYEPPPPPPEPEKPDLGSVHVADKIVDVGRANATMLGEIRDQIAKLQYAYALKRPRHWTFPCIVDPVNERCVAPFMA